MGYKIYHDPADPVLAYVVVNPRGLFHTWSATIDEAIEALKVAEKIPVTLGIFNSYEVPEYKLLAEAENVDELKMVLVLKGH